MTDAGEAHAPAHAFMSPLLNAATAPSIVAITALVFDAQQIAGTDKSAIAAVRATMAGLRIFNAFSF
jgi:hypothetical protein